MPFRSRFRLIGGRLQQLRAARDARTDNIRVRAFHVQSALRAARLSPSEDSYGALAQLLADQGNSREATRAMAMAERLAHGELSLRWCILGAWIAVNLGDRRRAEMLLSRALRIDPTSESATYLLGSLLAFRGALPAARRLFRRDVPVVIGNGHVTYTRILCPDDEAPSGARAVAPGAVRWLCGELSHDDMRPVYLVAADSVYFLRYARALLTSLRLCGMRLRVVVHVVNPSPEVVAAARVLHASGDDFCATFEETALDGLSPEGRSTYYACARYFALSFMADDVATPIVVADIDQVVMRTPRRLFDLSRRHDVCVLRFDHLAHNIFALVSATVMVVEPTPAARRFCAELLANLKSAFRDDRRLLWHLDQALLALAVLGAEGVRVGRIPSAMLHLVAGEPRAGRLRPMPIFWSITNSQPDNLCKLESPSFAKFVE